MTGPDTTEPEMTGPALVSVVVPAYNVAPYLAACVGSIVAQDLGAWRCIVVDDGSTDDPAARLPSSDARLTVIRQDNRGVAAARNRGLQAVDTPFVMFLDGDDLLHPTALRRLLHALQARPEPAAAFGTLVKVLEDGTVAPQQKPLSLHRYPSGNVLEAMIGDNFLANGGHVLLRTDAARAIGGFDERLRLSEDWEFWCRLAAMGEFAFIGTEPPVFYLRLRRGSATSGMRRWSDHQASIDAVLGNPTLQARFSPARWKRLSRAVLASHLWEAGRVNFTTRHHGPSFMLMMRSLAAQFRMKRAVLLLIAQLSRLLNRSFTSRLRFQDHDFPK